VLHHRLVEHDHDGDGRIPRRHEADERRDELVEGSKAPFAGSAFLRRRGLPGNLIAVEWPPGSVPSPSVTAMSISATMRAAALGTARRLTFGIASG